MVNELESTMLESSTRSPNFKLQLILNTNLIEQKLKIGYLYNSVWDYLDWETAFITTTLSSTTNRESLKVLHTHP